jgi:formyl-CoA transferase/succinyl-CoA--D-citramalate CoA-transferase
MLDDPHFQERGSLQTVRDERHGELTMQAVVPRLSDTPGSIRSAGPALGADTDIITAIENADEDLAVSAMSSHILAARYSALQRP